jgi:plastocyanin
MAEEGFVTRRLRVLMNGQMKPVYVVDVQGRREAMEAVVKAGDSVEWTSNKSTPFTVRFRDGSGNPGPCPFVGWTNSEKASSGGKVSGDIGPNAGEVVYKYDVTAEGGTLDPKIIIET